MEDKTKIPKELQTIFSGLNMEIRLYPSEKTKTFKSLRTFREFLEKEVAYWTDADTVICNRFQNALNELDGAIDEFCDGNIDSVVSHLSQPKAILAEGMRNLSIQNYIAFSSTAEARMLKAFQEDDEASYDGARDFLLLPHLQIAYYENRHNNVSKGPTAYTRGIVNSAILCQLKRQTEKTLEAANTDLADTQVQLLDLVEKYNTQYDDQEIAIEGLNAGFKNTHTKAEQNHETQAENLEDRIVHMETDAKERIDRLEKLYHEKLSLEAPVQYWETHAKGYRIKGWNFSIAAIIWGGVLAVILLHILYVIPVPLLDEFKWNMSTIRSGLAFLTLTSVGGYVLHILAKFAISSFHLERDALERRNLTYVFLSLLENESVKDDASIREIVLQSLFSRADTGLLKGESSPVMPGIGGLAEILKSRGG